jgi:hypothetical protein
MPAAVAGSTMLARSVLDAAGVAGVAGVGGTGASARPIDA